MTAHAFNLIFLGFLVFSTLLQLWLKTRQQRHVLANRDRVPTDFAADVSLDEHQKAADYTVAKVRLGRIVLVWDSLVVLAFTLGGGLAWIDEIIHAHVNYGVLPGVLLFAGYSLITSTLNLPFSLYSIFVLEARFGFNRMSFKVWLGDLARDTLVSSVFILPFIALVLWIMDKAGPYWWLYAWGAFVAFVQLMQVLGPTIIAPLYNKFTPLEDEALKQRVVDLLRRCGFTTNGVFIMDGSKRSSHGNAYFAGFGKTKRIVFFDTLIERLQPDQIEAILAHELGHYRLRHVFKRVAVLDLLSLVALAVLGVLKGASWFYLGLGVTQPSTAAALLLFMMALPVFFFPFGWVGSHGSRKHEYEADAYAVEMSSSTDLISGLVKLYRDNAATLTPDPLHSLFYDSHPPASLRINALRAAAKA